MLAAALAARRRPARTAVRSTWPRSRRCRSAASTSRRCQRRCRTSSTREQLVLANAVTTTSGSVVTAPGVGIGLALRHSSVPATAASAVIACRSGRVYLVVGCVAARMPARLLGPERRSRLHCAIRSGTRWPAARGRQARLAAPRRARRACSRSAATRLLFGLSTIGDAAALPQLLPRRGCAAGGRRRARAGRGRCHHRLPDGGVRHPSGDARSRQGAMDRRPFTPAPA